MRIAYLVANQAWVVLFGDALVTLDGVRFFETRAEVRAALRRKGLRLQSKQVVTL